MVWCGVCGREYGDMRMGSCRALSRIHSPTDGVAQWSATRLRFDGSIRMELTAIFGSISEILSEHTCTVLSIRVPYWTDRVGLHRTEPGSRSH